VRLQTILLASACIAFLSTCCSGSAYGAEFNFQTGITISEEYTDNLFLTTTNQSDEYITRVLPGIRWTYQSPLWEWDVAYAYDHRYYANYRVDQDLYTLNLKNHTRILGDFLQLDIEDVHARKPLSVVRDWTQESLFLNQTDINTFIVTPSIRMRTSSNSRVTIGYWYRNIWHQDPTAIDTIDHRVYTTANYELSAKFTTNMDVRYTSTEAGNDYRRKMDLFAGFTYSYAMDSKSWFTIGNSWFAFGTAGQTSQVVWDAGIAQKSGKYTYSFATKLTYVEDPFFIVRREDRYVATIDRDTERTSLGLSAGRYEYRDAVTKHLENTRHALTGKISHASTQTSKLIYELSIGRIEDNVLDRYTDIYLGGVRLEYMPSATLTVALQYRYANAYSAAVYTANYDSNRVMLEIKKTF
jgi:hypothetical protein